MTMPLYPQSRLRNAAVLALRADPELDAVFGGYINAEQPVVPPGATTIYTPQIVVQDALERTTLNREVGSAAQPLWSLNILLMLDPAVVGTVVVQPDGLSEVTAADYLTRIQVVLDSASGGTGKLPNPEPYRTAEGKDWLNIEKPDYFLRPAYVLMGAANPETGERLPVALVFVLVATYRSQINPNTGNRR